LSIPRDKLEEERCGKLWPQ